MDAEPVFNEVVADTDYAMYVVTAADGDDRAGCLVGFTTQCSISPPRFLVCLSKANRTYSLACRARSLGVHLLRHDQRELASLFGELTGDEVDKFARCRWEVGPEGVPLLTDCDSWFVGTVLGRFDLGDHEGFHLAPVQAERRTRLTPITFQSLKDLVPGHRVEEG
ncbi:MAG TPA: flavin reductase family protein [Acidimicrobiales bacterium]|nr:flavin reductase family protein [Acidimicrobiales bacterium]